MYAAKSGNREITRLLVKGGASLDITDEWNNTPLSLALGNGHSSVVKILVEHGADINQVNGLGRSLLTEAIKQNFDAALIRLLIETGCQYRGFQYYVHTIIVSSKPWPW